MSSHDPRSKRVLEVRLHGRGGQGGVTCAKILAAVWARLGKSVQSFGDYAGERAGAPIRAYTRVSDEPITDRNKVYRPDHLLVLDLSLLSADVVTGLAPGGTLLVNSTAAPEEIAAQHRGFRVATVGATEIARRHGIGTKSVVIVNTTIAGAFVRAMGLPLDALEATYRSLGFASNLAAAREAYEQVRFAEPGPVTADGRAAPARLPDVLPLVAHREGAPPPVHTGNWRTQTPRYVRNLAPCNAICPAGNDVVAFLHAAARGDEAAAAAILGRTTPFASVCGRICAAPCEDNCNRRPHDGAVRVRALERFVADRVPVAAVRAAQCAAPRRVAIVGGGPAGLSAAYTLQRLGHRATVFEGESRLGGFLAAEVPQFRLPREVVTREIDAILRLGVEVRLGRFLVADDVAALAATFDAVILATGLGAHRQPDVPGAGLAGIEQGAAFLREAGAGPGRRVAGHVVVLGSDETALDCARTALRCGASLVTVAHGGPAPAFRSQDDEIEEALREGVSLLHLRAVESFEGADRARGVVLAELAFHPDGSATPTDRRETLAADVVLIATDRAPDASCVPPGWTLLEGAFRDGERALHVFAAGDSVAGARSIAHAVGDGRRVAMRALAAAGVAVSVPHPRDPSEAVPPDAIRFDHYAHTAPAQQPVLPLSRRLRGFDEVRGGLGDASDASRCLSCGKCTQCDTCLVYCPEGVIHRRGNGYTVDAQDCKGCGVCVAVCPRCAMEMSS